MSSHSQSVVLPAEPTFDMLKALAGDPVILAASDEQELRRRYQAMIAAAPKSAGPAGTVHYERRPELDKRFANGDDYAGDAWVRWVAVGQSPQSEAGADDGWIPVSERRPEHGERVLATGWHFDKPDTSRWTMIAKLGDPGHNGSDWWSAEEESEPGENIYNPTHWMPLPASPSRSATEDDGK